MSLIEFHKATTSELLAVSNRVRNLVNHWGEDGRYKEAVLKNVIKRFIPERYSIATGFVVKQTPTRGEHLSSRQIDLIIYDDSSPVLFKEGDFVILTPDSVRAIIEVKNNIQNQGLRDVIEQANENGEFIYSGKRNKSVPFFNGVFGFEGVLNRERIEIVSNNFEFASERFRENRDFIKFKVNHVALNKDIFIKFWKSDNLYSLYDIGDLSFSFFISNLVDSLANKSVDRNNFIWFANDKELNLITNF